MPVVGGTASNVRRSLTALAVAPEAGPGEALEDAVHDRTTAVVDAIAGAAVAGHRVVYDDRLHDRLHGRGRLRDHDLRGPCPLDLRHDLGEHLLVHVTPFVRWC
jgi:hypothetical protein